MLDGKDNIRIPAAFSGNGQLVLYTRYDDPRTPGWENKWLVNWHVQQVHPWFPEKEIKIHKHFWPLLQDAFLELEKMGLHNEIRTFHCSYKLMYLQESPVLSVHSWGAAIDLNAEDNPKGSLGTWSDELLQVMQKHGIHCGQKWTGNTEPMHFSMVEGE